MSIAGKLPRIAVIGGGHLGRIHAKLLAANDQCHFVAVADPSAASRELVQSTLKLPTVEDYRDLEHHIDGVIIAAPTFLHHEIGRWCLERGIHVFMEKPIAASTEQAHELVVLAYENHATLQVGHVERFNPAWKTVCATTRSESVRYIEAVREGAYSGRSTDIGIVMDLMIHDIDLILSLIQSPVEQVQAYGWQVLGQHEDFAVAQLRFRNGAMAQLRASRIAQSPKRAMSLYCEDGVQHIDFGTSQIVAIEARDEVKRGERLADALPAEARSKVKDELFESWLHRTEIQPPAHNAIGLEHSEFIQSMRTGESVTVSGHAGTAALSVAREILDAMQRTKQSASLFPSPIRIAA
ncbi:Gfo/Idh/MocA family protein [Pirellulaceae bacterium SH467]|jgi:predicted dehydrogenase